jgi:GNAT superfamily N-acetyltransferase
MDDVARFAEDAVSLVAPGPDEERVEDRRSVVTFSPGTHFWCVTVGRLRFDEGRVERDVGEIRELIRARGREASVWTVGDSATPPGLATSLETLGMEREGTSDVLVLTHRPAPRPASGLAVRRVGSLDDLHAWIDVSAEGFGWSGDVVGDERARADATLRAERSGAPAVRMLALDGDRPVGVMRAWFAPWGAYLGGAATLPAERRRGVMSTLVSAAWQEAARRGPAALVALGGVMSSSTFTGLGFERTGEIVHLIDRR